MTGNVEGLGEKYARIQVRSVARKIVYLVALKGVNLAWVGEAIEAQGIAKELN